MEATLANRWAADIARYLKAYKTERAMALRARIKHMVHGHELDKNDVDQLERGVRRRLFCRTSLCPTAAVPKLPNTASSTIPHAGTGRGHTS